MHIHIALYRWKPGTQQSAVQEALDDVEALKEKVPGIVEISCGENSSRYSEGYTHAILVRGRDQHALDAYRNHPDHIAVAKRIESMESHGIGVDFIAHGGQ